MSNASSSSPEPNSLIAATDAAPAFTAGLGMPSVLESLVKRTSASVFPIPSSSSSSSSSGATASAEPPVSTQLLLQQVDSIYQEFTQVVRIMSHAKRARSQSPTSRQKLCLEMEKVTGTLKGKVASLQRGIRSKIGQTGRFVIVQQLKQEIDERRRAIAKIESVLEECHAKNPDK